jgi:hypothetical protein
MITYYCKRSTTVSTLIIHRYELRYKLSLITLCVVLTHVFKQLITVSSYRSNLLYVDRRDGRKRWCYAPREGGDTTSSEVKSKEQEMVKRRKYDTTIIE